MKTHPLSVSHLVIGLVFLAISGAWALHAAGLIDGADVSWLGPVALIVAGGTGLVATVVKGSRRSGTGTASESEYQPTYDPPLHHDYTSDIDRRLAEQQAAVAAPAADASGADPADDTTVVRTTEDETKEEDR